MYTRLCFWAGEGRARRRAGRRAVKLGRFLMGGDCMIGRNVLIRLRLWGLKV